MEARGSTEQLLYTFAPDCIYIKKICTLFFIKICHSLTNNFGINSAISSELLIFEFWELGKTVRN